LNLVQSLIPILDDSQTHQSSYKFNQQIDTYGDDNTLDAPLLGKSIFYKEFQTKNIL